MSSNLKRRAPLAECSGNILSYFPPLSKKPKSGPPAGELAERVALSAGHVASVSSRIAARAAEIARMGGSESELLEMHEELVRLLEDSRSALVTLLPSKSALPPPSDPPFDPPSALLGPLPGHVATRQHVFTLSFSKFQRLFAVNPGHPIFGEPESGKIQAPLDVKGRNPCSWRAKCDYLAVAVEKSMGPFILPGSCWMKTDCTMTFQRKDKGGQPVVLASFMVTRLLAFVTSPTDENWLALTGQLEKKGRSVDSPFTHWCHNGHGSKGGRLSKVLGCVNGVEHGRFANAAENASQKRCRLKGRAHCPGHGEPPSYCVYVHDDGVLKPCLNRVEGTPSCACARKCF